MTKEQLETLADMRESILASHPVEKDTCRLAGKLLTAHAEKPDEPFFCEALIGEAWGETTERRILSMRSAYEMLDAEGYMVEAGGVHGVVPIGGQREMHLPGYELSDDMKRVLKL
jgi:hypothetical protein